MFEANLKFWKVVVPSHQRIQAGALGARALLAPKISSKSCSCQAILRTKPIFWAIFGVRTPLWVQNSIEPPPDQTPGSAPASIGHASKFSMCPEPIFAHECNPRHFPFIQWPQGAVPVDQQSDTQGTDALGGGEHERQGVFPVRFWDAVVRVPWNVQHRASAFSSNTPHSLHGQWFFALPVGTYLKHQVSHRVQMLLSWRKKYSWHRPPVSGWRMEAMNAIDAELGCAVVPLSIFPRGSKSAGRVHPSSNELLWTLLFCEVVTNLCIRIRPFAVFRLIVKTRWGSYPLPAQSLPPSEGRVRPTSVQVDDLPALVIHSVLVTVVEMRSQHLPAKTPTVNVGHSGIEQYFVSQNVSCCPKRKQI